MIWKKKNTSPIGGLETKTKWLFVLFCARSRFEAFRFERLFSVTKLPNSLRKKYSGLLILHPAR